MPGHAGAGSRVHGRSVISAPTTPYRTKRGRVPAFEVVTSGLLRLPTSTAAASFGSRNSEGLVETWSLAKRCVAPEFLLCLAARPRARFWVMRGGRGPQAGRRTTADVVGHGSTGNRGLPLEMSPLGDETARNSGHKTAGRWKFRRSCTSIREPITPKQGDTIRWLSFHGHRWARRPGIDPATSETGGRARSFLRRGVFGWNLPSRAAGNYGGPTPNAASMGPAPLRGNRVQTTPTVETARDAVDERTSITRHHPGANCLGLPPRGG